MPPQSRSKGRGRHRFAAYFVFFRALGEPAAHAPETAQITPAFVLRSCQLSGNVGAGAEFPDSRVPVALGSVTEGLGMWSASPYLGGGAE